jgi:hypothetical protein
MTTEEKLSKFHISMDHETPPVTEGPLLALWHDGKGSWDKAHELVQDDPSSGAAWIHAYLHRKEGDLWNADYWYRRAGRERPDCSVEKEWNNLVREFLLNG